MSKQLIISIGREYGSGGHEIATKIAEKYGLPLYDHNILDQIAQDRGLDVKLLEEYDEKKRNMLLTRTVRGMTNSPENSVANLQFDFLKDKAASGESFVIVGRCAEKVLAGTEGLITFFILGDKNAKTERIMKLHHMNRHDAEVFIAEKDRRRKRYHNSRCELHWGDSRAYEFSINSSKLGIDETVRIMCEYIDARRA